MKINELIKGLKHIEVSDLENVNKEFFNETYGFPARPVLFSKAFLNWDIKKRWTIDFIISKLGKEVFIENVEGDKIGKKSISQFLKDNSRYEYIRTSISKKSDFYINDNLTNVFNCWYEEFETNLNKRDLRWLYIGNENSYTDIHRDIWRLGSWLYLLEGLKLWFIYPKAYNKIIEKNKQNFGIEQMDSILELDYKPMVAIQYPGQMIYVPSNCFHWVYNIEKSIAYTGNFINEINYDEVRMYFRDNKNYKFINNIIEDGFKRNELAKEYEIKH